MKLYVKYFSFLKRNMNQISTLIQQFTLLHQKERKGKFSKTKNSNILTQTLPQILESTLSEKYIVK